MNPQELNLRYYRVDDDVSEITALLHQSYRSLAKMGFKYVATHQNDEITERRLHSGTSFVGEIEGKVVSTISLYQPKPDSLCEWYCRPAVWTFGQFAVHPDLQRLGYGHQMILRIEREALEKGAEYLALDTAEGASHLVDWYQRIGYQEVERVSWPSTNYRSVIMSKRLADG